jgi:hypothetical protein
VLADDKVNLGRRTLLEVEAEVFVVVGSAVFGGGTRGDGGSGQVTDVNHEVMVLDLLLHHVILGVTRATSQAE